MCIRDRYTRCGDGRGTRNIKIGIGEEQPQLFKSYSVFQNQASHLKLISYSKSGELFKSDEFVKISLLASQPKVS